MSAQSAIFNPTLTTSAASGSGFSVPRLTTTGRLAIAFGTGDSGMMVYDTTLNNLFIWTGSAWESVPASGDAGVNGAVQYNDNGVVSGATNFVYNKVNQKVGIGTITPNVELDVVGNATITGDLTVRTTGLTVNSSGVGVGTSSQSSFLGNSPRKLVIGDGTQSPALTLYGGNAASQGIYFADGTVGTEAYQGFIQYDHNTDVLDFGTGGANAMTVNASRNLAFPTGKGIDFSATAGIGTSELLNDYEEGIWTIGLTFGGENTGLTTSSNAGRYTKVGRQVTVSGYIELTNKGSSTGSASITGLPFTIAAPNASYPAASLRLAGVSYIGAFQGFGAVNTTLLGLEQLSTLGAVSSLTDANFVNTSSVIFTLTYTV